MDGQLWRCRNPLRDAGDVASFRLECDLEGWKNDVMGFCRKGAMPLTFHEKMRKVFAPSGGSGSGAAEAFGDDVCVGIDVCASVFRRFTGGGLMSRFISRMGRGSCRCLM
jgi:hypothetical protein